MCCAECPHDSGGAVAGTFVTASIVVVGALAFYMHNIHIKWDEADEKASRRILTVLSPAAETEDVGLSVPHRSTAYRATAIFKIVLGHIQILVLIVASSASFSSLSPSTGSEHSAGFPSELRSFASYLAIVLLRVFHVVPLACVSSSPFQVNLILNLAFPAIVLALVAVSTLLLVQLRKRCGRELSPSDVYERFVKAFCLMLVLIYPLLSAELLEAFFHRTCGDYLDTVGLHAG